MTTEPKAKETPPAAPNPETPPQELNKEDRVIQVLDTIVSRLESLEKTRVPDKPNAIDDPFAYLDTLEEETATPPKTTSQPSAPDFDNMSRAQLVDFMMQQVGQQYVQPMVNRIETLRVKAEVRDVKAANPDFDDYKNEVLQIGMRNPTLSVQEAYELAKTRNPKPKKEDGVPPAAKSKVVPLETLARSGGERPRQASSSTTPSGPKTTKEAAEKAWADVMEGQGE